MTTKVLVTSEIAGGVVNGVNKDFTTAYQISNINLLTVNGSEYAQYSFTGNTISLDDAPASGQVLVTYSYESNFDYLDNSGWIVGEVASGLVNGTNTIYSVFYPISVIDEVRVNGVPTVGYTIVGNSIKLPVAPSTGYVEVDYFRKDLVMNDYQRDIYYTKKEVRDMVYDEIGQDDTSAQYPKQLVDVAISDGVSELVTQAVDKSRFVPFHIFNQSKVNITTIDNSNSSLQINGDFLIPPSGRLMKATDGITFDYKQVTSGGVVSISPSNIRYIDNGYYHVGYRLPRNIKRIVSVTTHEGLELQDAGNIPNFVFGSGGYIINNGYIYLNGYGRILIEAEVNEYIFGVDNSLVFIDRDDIGVVVYYALRQLYQSRESDKLNSAAQIYMDKLASYKKRVRKKRSTTTRNLMKTNRLLTQ